LDAEIGTTGWAENVAEMMLLVKVLERVLTSDVCTGRPATRRPGKMVTFEITAEGEKFVVVIYVLLLTDRFATANILRFK
jgi:hypothetical protein